MSTSAKMKIAACAVLALSAQGALAGTAWVTTLGDNGNNATPLPGSLRAAIKAANAATGPVTIRFDLGGSCPNLLTLTRLLPDITGDVTIDGTTLAGWTPNRHTDRFESNLCLTLNGAGLSWAFHVPATAPASTHLVVRGLGFTGFSDAAIKLESGSRHGVSGSQFGGVGFTLPNRNAIRVTGNSGGALIGGFDDAQTLNLFAGSSADAILLDNAAGTSAVVGNLFGFLRDGLSPSGNRSGVAIFNSKNNVLENNTIGNSASHGVTLAGAGTTGNVLQYNFIGLWPSGGTAAPNGGAGVQVSYAANRNTIGAAANMGYGGNHFQYNDGPGVWISNTGGTGNSVAGNLYIGNGGLAVDLGPEGADANQPANPTMGPNHRQNYPELATALRDNDYGIEYLTGTLVGTPFTPYRIDVYFLDTCGTAVPGRGEGWPLAQTTVTTSYTGVVPFTLSLPGPPFELFAGYITTTATDPAGNTSEMGNCVKEKLQGIYSDAGGTDR